MNDAKGYRTTSKTQVIWNSKSSVWEVKMNVIQEKTFDGVEWDAREISSQAFGVSADETIQKVAKDVYTYLETVGGDLFLEGSDGKQ